MTKEASAWMPFYIGDYLGDTQRLTTEQHGAYLLLILDYWRNGPAPDDDAVLQQITKLDRAGWKRCRPALQRLFNIVDGEWRHKRIEHELDRARANADRRSSKAREGAGAKWGESIDGEKGRHLRSERLAAARKIASHSARDWEVLKEICGNICVRCGTDGALVKDHIKPIYQGGSDGIDNIQPLCKTCNSSKGPEATDHRPNGWQNALEMPARMPGCASAPPSPSPLASSEANPQAGEIIGWVGEAARAAGIASTDPGRIAEQNIIVRTWIDAGADRGLVITTIERCVLTARKPPRSLRYFDAAVRQALDEKAAPATESDRLIAQILNGKAA